jgi:cytochrome c oxidase assembly factor CtaG
VNGLASAWDPAPTVLVGAGLVLALFVQGFIRLRRRGRTDHADWSRLLLYLIAVALGTLPLVSPLDEVGDSYLLSGHMLQHVLIGDTAPALALVALRGPLLFFLVPPLVLQPLARLHALRRLLAFLLHPVTSLAVWMLVIAGWHVPVAYDYALRNQTVHDLEHLSFIVAGLLVWMQILDPARRGHLSLAQRLGYMLVLSASGAVLAGLLVSSTALLYPSCAGDGPRLFGISPLRDQQLAGIVMVAEQLAALGACSYFLLRARVRIDQRRAEGPVLVPVLGGRHEL